jgi:hypothetical protein
MSIPASDCIHVRNRQRECRAPTNESRVEKSISYEGAQRSSRDMNDVTVERRERVRCLHSY